MAKELALEIFAHRGSSGEAPENTLAAFRLAVQQRAAGVEMDVHAAKGGEPVVIHDESVRRTTGGTGAVGDFSPAELGRMDAGGWFDPSFAGEKVPSLAEVLHLLAPSELRIALELKTNVRSYPGLVERVLESIGRAGLERRVVLSSFNLETLAEAMALAPGLEFAVLLDAHPIAPWDFGARHGFQALHPPLPACTAELVRQSHAAGLRVRPYTVDDRASAHRLFALGVDGLFTNFPLRMRQWWEQWAAGGG